MNNIHEIDAGQALREILSRLLSVATLMTQDMNEGLAAGGLTQARAHILWELGNAECSTQRELAQRIGVTPRNITALVDALEASGFVQRLDHPRDRRAILVALTDQGVAAVARMRADMGAFAAHLFAQVHPADLEVFDRVLAEVEDRLKAKAGKMLRPDRAS